MNRLQQTSTEKACDLILSKSYRKARLFNSDFKNISQEYKFLGNGGRTVSSSLKPSEIRNVNLLSTFCLYSIGCTHIKCFITLSFFNELINQAIIISVSKIS